MACQIAAPSLYYKMITEPASLPRVLILDDEEVHRMTITLQLKGLCEFVCFADPRPAIEYLKANSVDAAIVDVRMPFMPVDGLWFLQQLRAFDSLLGVVMRTADDDVSIAQACIEARAVQRIIKSEPGAKAKLRESVIAAISETRMRREQNAASSEARAANAQLLSALGRTDDELTTAGMCFGFIQGIAPQVMAMNGYTSMLARLASSGGDPRLKDTVEKTHAIAERLSRLFSAFLANPFVASPSAGVSCSGNACIDALSHVFKGHALFVNGSRRLSMKSVPPDAIIKIEPSRLLTALRHLVEYCGLRARAGAEVSVGWAHCNSSEEWINSARDLLMLNARFASGRPCAAFAVECDMGGLPMEDIRFAMKNCSEDPRVGNLFMAAAMSLDEGVPLAVSSAAGGVTSFRLFIPLA